MSLRDLAFGQLDVWPRVAERDLVVGCDARGNRVKLEPPKRAQCGVESGGLLRMSGAGEVFF